MPKLFPFSFSTLHVCFLHIHTLTHSHKQEGTGWVCLFKHSRSLLISNLSEFCPIAHVSTRVRGHTTGCECLSHRPVVSHSLTISVVTSTLFGCASFVHSRDASGWFPLCSFIYVTSLLLWRLQILVNKFSSAINTQRSRVTQLEEDTINLSDDISSLKDKVECCRQGLASH